MGVEYQHWLVVPDRAFVASRDAGARVHEVLERWGLGGSHEVHDISAGGSRRVDGPLPGVALPDNALVWYRDTVRGAPVEALVGRAFDAAEPDDYVRSRSIVLSHEQHVLEGGEDLRVDVTGTESTICAGPRGRVRLWRWAPPTAQLTARIMSRAPLEPGFDGVFRAALVLDFGKSLPGFVRNGGPLELEDRDFVAEIEAALGASVVEVGVVD